ncbi:hypothetical protein [Levilactobacillus bambusae]|uniref:Uncharacterized protein n=1 Tax=Levilactobacillus bambusae TaxID=2024736 RepID=A0A2V1MXT1_9LACO|nr:hypothetical protein [Levilactobacillus bambusae]PWF99641.1 hypothetical protein DCM90_07435 [Levilactobacillus bambusae]
MEQPTVPKRIILAEYLVDMFDAQRQDKKTVEDILPKTEKLVESTKSFNIPVYVLTNAKISYNTPELTILTASLPPELKDLSLYMLRWVMAYQFVLQHPEIEELVLVDLGDVVMLKNPFGLFDERYLYMGDELTDLNIPIINTGYIPDYGRNFLRENQLVQGLNPGVIGGKRAIVLEFLSIMANLICQTEVEHQIDGKPAIRPFEMGLIDYIFYRYFATRMKHGRQVTTLFYFNRPDIRAWFKHK